MGGHARRARMASLARAGAVHHAQRPYQRHPHHDRGWHQADSRAHARARCGQGCRIGAAHRGLRNFAWRIDGARRMRHSRPNALVGSRPSADLDLNGKREQRRRRLGMRTCARASRMARCACVPATARAAFRRACANGCARGGYRRRSARMAAFRAGRADAGRAVARVRSRQRRGRRHPWDGLLRHAGARTVRNLDTACEPPAIPRQADPQAVRRRAASTGRQAHAGSCEGGGQGEGRAVHHSGRCPLRRFGANRRCRPAPHLCRRNRYHDRVQARPACPQGRPHDRRRAACAPRR